MDINQILKNVQNLHSNIANDVWPDGQDMVCKVCGYEIHATSGECGYYLAHGWPEHCGKTMRLGTKSEHQ